MTVRCENKCRPVKGAQVPAELAFTTRMCVPLSKRTKTAGVAHASGFGLPLNHGMVRQIKWWESLYEFLVVQLKHVDNNYNVDPVSALLWLELTQAALA